MSATIIVGSQWGDEGKGKLIDYLAQKADFVVRYNGSGGAAHTVVNEHGTFKLHLLPCGAFSKKTKLLITNGVVIEPELLLSEIEMVEKAGFNLKNRLTISPRCHLVFPYHKILDKAVGDLFAKTGKSPTTGRGNGPVNADKITYTGIRLYDLYDANYFSERLETSVTVKNKFIEALGAIPVDYSSIKTATLDFFAKIKPYLAETLPLVNQALAKGQKVIFEGVNGVMLDNDWGAYPYVTTASTLPSYIAQGAGVALKKIKYQVIGSAKSYMTRVDNGECPLPSEWEENQTTKDFRDRANEYAAGTGRPRRIAWFDTEVLKFTNRLCSFDQLFLTRLDTLSGFKKLKICVGYTYQGKKVTYLDGDAQFYRKVKPVYLTLDGWSEDISICTKFSDLPINVKRYVKKIEQLVGIKVKYIANGPKRENLIVVN
ncbi:adenylosuccinate synthase [Candidatus Microgenomates bacterium]|nr:adenylosuccinate synthase [Candidatus Microgenomates bacterium]